MDALTTGIDGSKHIADSEVVIIVGVEIEAELFILHFHQFDVLRHFHWIEDAECVGQHEAFDGHVRESVHKSKNIVGTVFHAVTPVLQIYIDTDAFLMSIVDGASNVAKMLFERFV